jgi:hypothetical protein
MTRPQWARPFGWKSSRVETLPLLERTDRNLLLQQRTHSTNSVGGVPNQEQGMLDLWPLLGVSLDGEGWVVPLLHG